MIIKLLFARPNNANTIFCLFLFRVWEQRQQLTDRWTNACVCVWMHHACSDCQHNLQKRAPIQFHCLVNDWLLHFAVAFLCTFGHLLFSKQSAHTQTNRTAQCYMFSCGSRNYESNASEQRKRKRENWILNAVEHSFVRNQQKNCAKQKLHCTELL